MRTPHSYKRLACACFAISATLFPGVLFAQVFTPVPPATVNNVPAQPGYVLTGGQSTTAYVGGRTGCPVRLSGRGFGSTRHLFSREPSRFLYGDLEKLHLTHDFFYRPTSFCP